VDHLALLSLSRGDLITLIQAEAEQIAVLTARPGELEAQALRAAEDPRQCQPVALEGPEDEPSRPRGKQQPRPSRPGTARRLAEHPDQLIEALAAACPHCNHALSPADLRDIHAYDHVDLPPIQPITTRIHRHRGVCPCCHKIVIAPASASMEPSPPFGAGIAALVLHLHITKAISFGRLSRLMGEVFGRSISEGAIAYSLARAETPLLAACVPLAAAVRESLVVGSDKTSARVGAKTWWKWMMLSSTAICHVIADTRAAALITAFLEGARPEVWGEDRYGRRLRHDVAWQMCLAHLLRDVKYATDADDTVFARAFRLLLLRAVALGKRREQLADTTLAQYLADLARRLDRLRSGPMPNVDAGRKLFRAMRRDREDLFRFVIRRDLPYTHNACARRSALR
jgi:transposase